LFCLLYIHQLITAPIATPPAIPKYALPPQRDNSFDVIIFFLISQELGKEELGKNDDIEFRGELQDDKVDEIIQKPILLEDFTSAVSKHINN
jgi:hypothetical protein